MTSRKHTAEFALKKTNKSFFCTYNEDDYILSKSNSSVKIKKEESMEEKNNKIEEWLCLPKFYRLIGRFDDVGPSSLYLELERFKFGRSR